jgi:hypothetical protein
MRGFLIADDPASCAYKCVAGTTEMRAPGLSEDSTPLGSDCPNRARGTVNCGRRGSRVVSPVRTLSRLLQLLRTDRSGNPQPKVRSSTISGPARLFRLRARRCHKAPECKACPQVRCQLVHLWPTVAEKPLVGGTEVGKSGLTSWAPRDAILWAAAIAPAKYIALAAVAR